MKLQFSSTTERLFGRDYELERLNEIYNHVKTSRRSSAINEEGSAGPRFVNLQAPSGNGKTSLVNHFGIACSIAAAAATATQEDGVISPNEFTVNASHQQINNVWSTDKSKSRQDTNVRCFLKGKFDEHDQKPYAAFVDAFEALLSSILRNRQKEASRIEAIKKALDGDDRAQHLLLDMMPQLTEILRPGDSIKEDQRHVIKANRRRSLASLAAKKSELRQTNPARMRSRKSDSDIGMIEQRHQFRYFFQAFVRAVCNEQPQPIILFLDDLQWADLSSLELLKAVLNDSESTNLLVIGAYRGQEVDHKNHPLRATLNHLKCSTRMEKLYCEIDLENFALDDLNAFVAASLELAPQKTRSLSEVILRKTHGNIFYSKEFLKQLESQRLLRYDMLTFQWVWDTDEIAGSTNLSDNVTDLVASRILELPNSAVSILKIASCLWFSFDVSILEFIVFHARAKLESTQPINEKSLVSFGELNAELRVNVSTQSEVFQSLERATDMGLLDRMGQTSFKFSHDKVREATYSLIEEGGERNRLHLVIGEILWHMYHSQYSQRWMLFSSVDQLNKISSQINTPDLRLQLARVNLEAAECATSLSAFLPASAHVKAGIEFLGDTKWTDNYDLCLKLYTKLAALQSSLGFVTETANVIEEAIKEAKSFDDKLPLFTTQIESLSVQGKLSESLDLAFEVLEGLGESFPKICKGKSFERYVREDKASTAALLRSHTDATILALPLLTCQKKQYTLRILNLIIDPAFHTGQLSRLFLIINRMVRITLLNGLGRSSGVAFALYGFSLSSKDGNRRDNYLYGRLAVTFQEQLAAPEYDCRVFTYVYVLLNHWQEPLGKSLAPLLTAHSAGMASGDIDYAFQAAGAYLTLYWYSGRALGKGLADARRFMDQMKEYKQEKALTIYRPLFQCMLNMTSKDWTSALLLKGEAVSDTEFEEKKWANTTLMSYQMQLAFYFGDITLAESLSTKLQEVSKSFNAHYLFVARLFFFGMIALRVAFESEGRRRRRQQLKVARKIIKEMEQWTTHGGLNCLHKLLILKAEYHAFEFVCKLQRGVLKMARARDFKAVQRDFDSAIAFSTRTGFRNDAALAAERASSFCRHCDEKYLERSYFAQSIQFYREWGATAKVAQMRNDAISFEIYVSATHSETHTVALTRPAVDHTKLDLSHNEGSNSRIQHTFFAESLTALSSESRTNHTLDVSSTAQQEFRD